MSMTTFTGPFKAPYREGYDWTCPCGGWLRSEPPDQYETYVCGGSVWRDFEKHRWRAVRDGGPVLWEQIEAAEAGR